MKKPVTALCVYHGDQIYNITFIDRKGNSITMYDFRDDVLCPVYQSFTHMYNAVLILARNNGFTIPYTKEGTSRCYNIQWCDTASPNSFNRYPYYGRYGTF